MTCYFFRELQGFWPVYVFVTEPSMTKYLALGAFALSLLLSACSSGPNADEVPDVSPENLYKVAQTTMASGEFDTARRYLEAIDSRYPFGDFTSQVQLDLIYVYYKQRESELASAQVARFIRLSPTHPNIDYVYYMKGLIEMQKRADMFQDFLGLDRSQKDPTEFINAFNTFSELIESYPDSLYVADARQRMIFIKRELAKHELNIARYYYLRGAYVSAATHGRNIVHSYRNTPALKEALDIMIKSYDKLGLKEAKANTIQLRDETFPEGYRPKFMANETLPVDAAGNDIKGVYNFVVDAPMADRIYFWRQFKPINRFERDAKMRAEALRQIQEDKMAKMQRQN